MILALMLLTVDQHLARANALKNMLLGITTLVSAVELALFGPVDWRAAAALAVGVFAGSIVGPSLMRRLNGGLLRALIGLAGIGLAVKLWISPN